MPGRFMQQLLRCSRVLGSASSSGDSYCSEAKYLAHILWDLHEYAYFTNREYSGNEMK
jgi:hypothetical protein